MFQGAKYDAAPLLTALKKVFGAWCEQVRREGGRMGERGREDGREREGGWEREKEKGESREKERK